MSTTKATWKNGQVVLDDHAAWPDGRRLLVSDEQSSDIEFMSEEQQGDDPAAIERWIDELKSLPGVPEDPSQEAERLAWQEKVKAFNVNAVRRQMEEGIS